MRTIAERLRHVTLKVERAKEHVAGQLSAFIATNPYGIGCKQDLQSRKPIYYVSCAHPIPETIALVAGDAIQNLMSALDHLSDAPFRRGPCDLSFESGSA